MFNIFCLNQKYLDENIIKLNQTLYLVRSLEHYLTVIEKVGSKSKG